ncbi:MAG: hypothetical protein ACRCZK_04745, partial [Oscillospiraceae bacterium]
MNINLSSKKLFSFLFFFPLIYVFDIILGFSGDFIFIYNIPIRVFIFGLAFISLYCAFFIKIYGDNKKNYDLKNLINNNFTFLDIAVLFFLLVNFIWATFIPILNNGSLKMSFNEIDGMLTLFMFLPISYLIRKKHIDWCKIQFLILVLVLALSFTHIFLYLFDKENEYFIENFFNFIVNVLGSNGNIPNIIRGHGYTRVIFPSSILLFIGIYLILKKINNLKLFHIIAYAILIISILSTITKSLLLGGLIGFVFLLLYALILIRKFKTTLFLLLFLTITSFIITSSNYLLFDNLVFQRMINIYITDSDLVNDNLSDELKGEIEGSVESNKIRVKQVEDLLNKFLTKPLTGFGYGSFVENNIRGEKGFEYLYEMF